MTTTVHDPVCGMAVNPQHAAVSILYKGQAGYFVRKCARQFLSVNLRSN